MVATSSDNPPCPSLDDDRRPSNLEISATAGRSHASLSPNPGRFERWIDRCAATGAISQYLQVVRFLRPRWAVAQVGARRRGARALEMLPDASELPGPGWKIIDERCWRTGIAATEPWALRARAARSITAWRSFEQRSMQRWVWTQIIPLASDADAVEALAALPTRMLANLRANVTVTSRHDVSGLELPATQAIWAEEVKTSGDAGEGLALQLAWVAASTLSMIACSSLYSIWSWDEVTGIATTQLQRTRSLPANCDRTPEQSS